MEAYCKYCGERVDFNSLEEALDKADGHAFGKCLKEEKS